MVWFCSNYSITFGIDFFPTWSKRQKKRESSGTCWAVTANTELPAKVFVVVAKTVVLLLFFLSIFGSKTQMQQKFDKQEIELFFVPSKKNTKFFFWGGNSNNNNNNVSNLQQSKSWRNNKVYNNSSFNKLNCQNKKSPNIAVLGVADLNSNHNRFE